MKSKFDYIPPNLINESFDFKIERVVKLAKSARSDLGQLKGVDLGIEEQIIRFFELRDEVAEYQGNGSIISNKILRFLQIFPAFSYIFISNLEILKIMKPKHQVALRECEEDPAAKEDSSTEKVAKARHILEEIGTVIKQTGTESFTEKLQTENEFNVGMQKNLIPWISELEKESLKQLAKPDNFDHAREIEKEAVLFAKEVRKANKLMQQLESSIERLPDRKMFANQQIQEC